MKDKNITTIDQLRGVLFETPCCNCFESNFVLPFIANTMHELICPKCNKKNGVIISKKGSISQYREDEMEEGGYWFGIKYEGDSYYD